MAEILIGGLAWGALKLTSSLVSAAGFKKLIGAEEDAAMVEWSGDVVLNAREKSQQQQALVSSMRLPDMAPMSRALEAHQNEVSSSGKGETCAIGARFYFFAASLPRTQVLRKSK